MKEPSMAEIILAYFKLEEKTNKLISDIEYAKISEKSAKTDLGLYEELYFKLQTELFEQSKLYAKIKNTRTRLTGIQYGLKNYYGCKRNAINADNTEADQIYEDSDEDQTKR